MRAERAGPRRVPPGWLAAAALAWLLLAGELLGAARLPWPWAATTLSLALLLLVPGALLARLLEADGPTWAGRLTAALLLGFGFWSVPAVVCTALLRTSLAAVAWSGMAGIVLLIAAAAVRGRGGDDGAAGVGGDAASAGPGTAGLRLAFRAAAAAGIAAVVVLVVREGGPHYDRWTYLAFLRHFLDADAIFTRGFILSPDVVLAARDLFQPWLLVQAVAVRAAGADAYDAYVTFLPPLVVLLSYGVLWALARELFEDERAAPLACLVQTLLFLTTWTQDGNLAPLRLIEDKFFVRYVLLPGALWLALRHLRRGAWSRLAAFAVGLLGVVLTHPLGIVFLGLSLGPFLLLTAAWARERGVRARVLGLLLVAGVFALVPLWQRAQLGPLAALPAVYTADLQEGLSGLWARTRGSRLLVTSLERGRYILAPGLIAHPLVFLSLLLTPVLGVFARRDAAARFLVAAALTAVALCYTPGLTPLFGRIVTPWMLWRVLWLVPVALILTFFALRLGGRTARGRRGALPLALVLGGFLVLGGDVRETVHAFRAERGRLPSPELREALGALRAAATPGSRILTPSWQIDSEIPGLVGTSFGLAFRRERQLEAGVERARRAFYRSASPGTPRAAILERYGIDYLLADRAGSLAAACRAAPALFQEVHANGAWSVFRVRGTPGGAWPAAAARNPDEGPAPRPGERAPRSTVGRSLERLIERAITAAFRAVGVREGR